ncbi:MAG: rhomboid family intramembrane serine protease [Thiobacillus sp.]|uniref:rhomboid family intramembrane serine protease n=1 Tax=Thiobacillus sp. TaxID=924 RepID=UPI00168C3CE4|nr:rhomboid family intramembrane serine protease [Thiobacillus sp.]QLQ04018.1 MAG: rhomboid family intramembrane serine protease [Thiobacillus sp.]
MSLWLGALLGVVIVAISAKGNTTNLLISLAIWSIIFVPIDFMMRRKLKTDQPHVVLTLDEIESPLFGGKIKKFPWAEVANLSVKSIQNSRLLELQLCTNPGRSDKRNFWTGRNDSRPTIPLSSFASEDQKNMVDAINECLQHSRAARGLSHTEVQNPLAEEQEFQERLKAFAPIPWLTYLLVAVNVTVWIFTFLNGAGFNNSPPDKLIGWGGNAASEVQKGEWWRLLTAMFLHSGFNHLLMNMIGLVSIGITVERIYGHRLFTLIYFGSGLIGSALSLNYGAQHVVSVGASGAIFGIAGAMMVGMHQHKDKLPKTIGKQSIGGIAIFIAFNLLNGFAKQGIDNAAHVGGLIGGCLLAYLLPERFDMEHFVRHFQRKAIAGITVVFVATTGLTAIAPRATFDQRKAADGQAAFVRGMDGFLAAAKALQQDQLDVKAGKETERESDDKSRMVYAPMYRKVLMDLSRVSLQPNDPRLPLLQDARRMSELIAESLEMPSMYKNGSNKPEPADPVRAEAITMELKKLSAHFQQEVQKINAKKPR